jgi:hypothetical protein
MSLAKTRSEDRILIDEVRESPVDEAILRNRRITLIVLVALVALIAILLAWKFLPDKPVAYDSAQEHFKYGSIGSEPGGSLFQTVGGLLPPYWIFKVLPKIAPDKLPGGYASLGLIFEKGHDMPIGISRRTRLGFEQVGLNCASCHTGTYRASVGSPPVIVLGMPAHQLELQQFFDFVTSTVLDPRFTPDNVVGKIQEAGGSLNAFDRYLFKTQLVPRTREATLELRSRIAVLLGNPAIQWGAGRVDTFNPYKAIQFNWQLANLPPAELIGASDFPSLWNQKPREGMHLHWDGNNDSVDERNRSASLGTGATPVTLDRAGLARVKDWIWTLPPPKYPFAVDEALAAKGEAIYQRLCVDCHADQHFRDGTVAANAKNVGQIVPIEKIGTDPYRLNSYTLQFADNQYSLYPNSVDRFTHFRKTYGYANHPLDGIWARAPYLHNGSVPTLHDLLTPAKDRPKAFYRGYDVYDPGKVGFKTDVAEENGRKYFRYDTSLPGNGNGGHDYGTSLTDAEKQSLVEYMKTF